MKLISKEVSRAKPEYMNIHPPPPPISVLAMALLASAVHNATTWFRNHYWHLDSIILKYVFITQLHNLTVHKFSTSGGESLHWAQANLDGQIQKPKIPSKQM